MILYRLAKCSENEHRLFTLAVPFYTIQSKKSCDNTKTNGKCSNTNNKIDQNNYICSTLQYTGKNPTKYKEKKTLVNIFASMRNIVRALYLTPAVDIDFLLLLHHSGVWTRWATPVIRDKWLNMAEIIPWFMSTCPLIIIPVLSLFV